MLETLLSIVLTLALCLGLSVPALAALEGVLNGEICFYDTTSTFDEKMVS